MPYLLLDTSTDHSLLALIEGKRILSQKIFQHHNLLAKLLLPEIQTLLNETGVTTKELTGITFGIGPGSYTGTRVGVSVGKSLAFALDIPAKPFASPLAFLPEQEGRFASLIQARSGSYFLLKGLSFINEVRQESASLIPPEELAHHLENVDFCICATPLQGVHKPTFQAKPNLLKLAVFIEKQPAVPLENIELLYLHSH